MSSIKIQKLLPAPVNVEEIKRWCGSGVNVMRVGDKSASTFVAYGQQSEKVAEVKGKIRDYAKSKNLILISGNEGVGKNEMYGKPFYQFLLKQKPAKNPSRPVIQPQALPSRPSAPLVNTSKPIPPIQPVQTDVTKKPQQRYQEQNRIGWTKEGFKRFYEMTKPGGMWSNIKECAKSGRPIYAFHDVKEFANLFETIAKYAPLVSMFRELGKYTGTNSPENVEAYRKLVARIQPRLERLYDFARREALVKTMAKRMVMKSLGRRLV